MDPELVRHYRAAPRPSVFLKDAPAPSSRRPLWPLLVFAALCGFDVVGCAVTLLNHIG